MSFVSGIPAINDKLPKNNVYHFILRPPKIIEFPFENTGRKTWLEIDIHENRSFENLFNCPYKLIHDHPDLKTQASAVFFFRKCAAEFPQNFCGTKTKLALVLGSDV